MEVVKSLKNFSDLTAKPKSAQSHRASRITPARTPSLLSSNLHPSKEAPSTRGHAERSRHALRLRHRPKADRPSTFASRRKKRSKGAVHECPINRDRPLAHATLSHRQGRPNRPKS